jgi:hypothetical protein
MLLVLSIFHLYLLFRGYVSLAHTVKVKTSSVFHVLLWNGMVKINVSPYNFSSVFYRSCEIVKISKELLQDLKPDHFFGLFFFGNFWALIYCLIKLRKWKWLGRMWQRPSNEITLQALEWNPPGKRNRGRSRNTW